MPVPELAENSGCISKDAPYSLAGFISNSGITYQRIRDAEKQGVPFPSFKIGRRVFITGSAALVYLDRLAAQSAAHAGGDN